MTQVSKRLPVLLALLVGLAMAFAVWALPNAVFADDEKQLETVSFGNGYDAGWAQFFFVAGLNGTVDMDYLNISVFDKGGNLVEPENYDLVISVNEGNEAIAGPYGIRDEVSGFTEYLVDAVAKEESEYVGDAHKEFAVADEHSLGFFCSYNDFSGKVNKHDWRMHDRFWLRQGQDVNLVVKEKAGMPEANILTEGEDYDVTYYRRSGSPEDMNNPDKPFEDILIASEDTLVKDDQGNPAVPTELGGYFARIEGIAPYYGGNDVLLDIVESDAVLDIFFETRGDNNLWSDQDKDYSVAVPEGIEGKLAIEVGFWNPDAGKWGEKFPDNEGYYEFNSATSTLTLHGNSIIQEYGDPNFPMTLYATITDASGKTLARGFEDVFLRQEVYDYQNMPDTQDELLPGWDGWIDKDIYAFIRNPKYPDGENFALPVTDINLDDPDGILELTNEGEQWKYVAKKPGEATIHLTYHDYDDTSVSIEIRVIVSNTVYRVDMRSANGFRNGLPGSSLTLLAQAEKELLVPNYDDPEHPDYDNTTKGLTYQWSVTEGKSYATITPDANDPAKAVLKFKALPNGQDWIDEQVKVKVAIVDSESDDPAAERTQRDEEFWVNSEFYQIWPAVINEDLEVGQTITLKPEVRLYRYGQKNYSVVKNVEYEMHHDDAVEVQENNGTFTIKRVKDWDTWFDMDARWDGGGAWQNYHLNNKDYRIEFGFWDVDLYDDSTVTISPQIRDAVSFGDNDYRIDYRVGTMHWDEVNEEDVWDSDVAADSGVYTVDGNKLIFDGAEMAKAGLNELRVRAELTINGENYGSEDCEVRLRVSCPTRGHDHNWIKSVVKNPTLTEVGYEFWICPDFMFLDGCGETRLVEIPKLSNISGATVSAVKNQTYTGKALTPALIVKVGSTALKAGTDYTAAYTNNTKVGNATVTLTGKGKYGGTKKATFKIVKAKNPMVIKTKAVTLKAKDVKKKNKTIKAAAAFAVTKNQGKVTYKKKSGDAKITIAANGTITVKKGLKKGKYKFVVNVTAAGDANYNKITKAATVNITVK